MSDYPMLISNKLHSFRNFLIAKLRKQKQIRKGMYKNVFKVIIYDFVVRG